MDKKGEIFKSAAGRRVGVKNGEEEAGFHFESSKFILATVM